MARRFAGEGMRLALADVEAGPLERTVDELRTAGHEAIGVVTDVRNPDAVQAFADAAVRHLRGRARAVQQRRCRQAGPDVGG